jgi:hypothetical protein
MAIVNINVSAYVDTELYNSIQLAYYPTAEVCDKTQSSYQISNSIFNESSLIYDTDNSVSAIGWYSDGTNKGYWDGSVISGYTTCTITPEGTLYSYKRDGSQNCVGFHLPYVEYIDTDGNPATFYADECSDGCGDFYALSITAIHYCTDC